MRLAGVRRFGAALRAGLRLAAVLRVVVLRLGAALRVAVFLFGAAFLAVTVFLRPIARHFDFTEDSERLRVLAISVAVLVLYIFVSLDTSVAVQAFAPGRVFILVTLLAVLFLGAAFLVVWRVVFFAAFLGDLRIELSPIFCLRFNVKKLINTNYFLHLYIIPKHKVGNMVKLSQYKNLFEDKKSRKIFLSHESISCFLK